MTDTPLTPPAATSTLVLTPPEPVAAVATTKAGGMVPLDQAALPGLDQKVEQYVTDIVSLDARSPAFGARADDIRAMGDDDIRSAAESSNRLLQAPMRAMSKGDFSEGSKVSKSLLDLRRTIEDLDPAQATGVKKLIGLIPFGDKLRDYFRKYESAQGQLDGILNSLYSGQDELRKDNASLEQEKANLWETMQRLGQYIYIAEHLDAALVAKIAEIEISDPDKAKALTQDVLFSVRQKHQDLLTQLAVSIQGYLAMDLVRKNNIELVKGVDRATTTTVSALRTAVIVAQALSNQRLVLDQINALNTTTSNMIQSTAELLATQSVEINKQAADATIGIDKLQAAFANVYQAMDEIDTFKVQALSSMQQTITALETEVDKSKQYVERVRSADQRSADGAGPLDLDSGGTP
ncbi:MAG: toxic anion resistance protein [Actinomycetota bacterium]